MEGTVQQTPSSPFGIWMIVRLGMKGFLVMILSIYIVMEWYYKFWSGMFDLVIRLSQPFTLSNLLAPKPLKRDDEVYNDFWNKGSKWLILEYLNIGFVNRLLHIYPSIVYFIYQTNAIAKMQCTKVVNVNDYADYVLDRYIIHATEWIFQNLRGKNNTYSYKGIRLSKGDGYSEYLKKRHNVKVEEISDEGPASHLALDDAPDTRFSLNHGKLPSDSTPNVPQLPDSSPANSYDIRGLKRRGQEPSLRQIKRMQVKDIKFPPQTNVFESYQSPTNVIDRSDRNFTPHPLDSFENTFEPDLEKLLVKSVERNIRKFEPSTAIKQKIDVLTLKANATTYLKTEPSPTSKNISELPFNSLKKYSVSSTIPVPKDARVNDRKMSFRIKLKKKPKIITDDEVIQVIDEIKKVIPLPGYDDGSLAPVLLRLAWHCCATYDKSTNTGGSNGATMRFLPEITDEANNGLDIARAAVEPIKQKFPSISYGDLWTLVGKVSVETMGGPTINWQKGRIDHNTNNYVPPNGRLPFADKDANHIRSTFQRMGFTDQEAVLLLGCHAMGRCHKRISGWEGKWTDEPTKFSNGFYKALLNETWSLGKVPETSRLQYYNGDKHLMMLITDFQLLNDSSFLHWVKIYASDEVKFFKDFAAAFEKLLELGIIRDHGIIVNHNN